MFTISQGLSLTVHWRTVQHELEGALEILVIPGLVTKDTGNT